MKKLLVALLVACGVAPGTASYATTFIVTNSTRMASVMDSVRGGDVVQINDGTYTVMPRPTGWLGGSPTSTSRIRIIGNTANASLVIVPGMPDCGNSYITWNAITFDGPIKFDVFYLPYPSFNFPVGDSVVNCHARNGECGMSAGTNITFYADTLGDNANDCNVVISGDQQGVATGGTVNPHFVNCIFRLKHTNPSDSKLLVMQGISGPASTINGMVFTGNKITAVHVGTATRNGIGWNAYYLENWTWADNKFEYWDSTATGMVTDNLVIIWRDGMRYGTSTRDTFIVRKGLSTRFEISSAGNNLVESGHRKFTNDVFRNLGTPKAGEGAFDWQNGMISDTLQNCIIAASDTTQPTIISHRTCGVCSGYSVWDHTTVIHSPYFGAINMPVAPNAGLSIRNCIFHSNSLVANASNSSIFFNLAGGGEYIRDYNLYAYKGKTTTVGDRVIRYTLNGVASTFSTAGTSGSWYLATGQDAHSKWGYSMVTPALASDSSAANYDSLQSTSAAASSDEFAGTIGAVKISADNTRPFAIADLAVTSTSQGLGGSPRSVTLSWTATGDDSITGTAKTYTIAYSPNSNMSASVIVSQTMVPKAVSGAETYTIVSDNLTLNATWYFTVIATDDAGNPSAASNTASVYLAGTQNGGLLDP